MSRERTETGEYVETVTTDRVLGVFARVDGPALTSADVAETLDCSRETARRKLSVLAEQGRVDRRKTAGRVIWWLTESEQATPEINPDGALFTGGAVFSTDEATDASKVDDYLYGEVENVDG
jgi:predicted ArsR family transcriptional regulator